MNRREFVAGSLSALVTGCLGTRTVGPGEDWREAFRSLGFDPGAEGCGTFAVVADVHVGNSDNGPFRGAVAFCNGMSPRPAFMLSCGDQLSRVSTCFGDRSGQKTATWAGTNEKEIALLKEIVAPLEIPFVQVIGNHDTYPEETDAAYYCGHFPGMRPYRRYDALGVQFLLLNGGHDGWIDPKQEAWLTAERGRLDPKRAVALVVHQPSLSRHCENGITRTVHRVFGDWQGELWLLGGHEHRNALNRFRLPGGGMLGAVTHARGPLGFWLYGVRSGSIAARLFFAPAGLETGEFGASKGTFAGWKSPEIGKMPSAIAEKGPLPLPFDGQPTKWRCLVGEDDDKAKYRVEFAPHSDAGHWYYYIGRTVYRLPLRKEAPGSTKAAFLGRLKHHRKTGEHEKVWLSADGERWTACPDVTPKDDLYVYDIPLEMRSAEWIYLRVDGFGYKCDSSIAGYALLA